MAVRAKRNSVCSKIKVETALLSPKRVITGQVSDLNAQSIIDLLEDNLTMLTLNRRGTSSNNLQASNNKKNIIEQILD